MAEYSALKLSKPVALDGDPHIGNFESYTVFQPCEDRQESLTTLTSRKMASRISDRCKKRNATIIPSLMGQHDAVLSGDTTTIDLSTAENWATKTKLLQGLEGVFSGLSEHV